MTDKDNNAHGQGHVQNQDQDQDQSFITMRQESGQKILVQFAKTFISVMESTVFSNTDSDDIMDEEAEEFFDNFGTNDRNSCATICQAALLVSDEDFAFEKYFPSEKRQEFRSLFIDVAFDIFRSYEYQLIMLVREERKISEIAEDIVHRILDNFKESQRGFNPEFIKPEITTKFLIEKTLHHSEPEGIIYNSEWSAVEILENPGILIRNGDQDDHKQSNFYQSDWQKNFLPYRKLIGSKYGFRLRFDFETEEVILKNFEKVSNSSVSPLYLNYEYRLDLEVADVCKEKLLQELEEIGNSVAGGKEEVKKTFKDKVKEFQMKLLIQKQEEDMNSDKVMKQVVNLSQRFDNLQTKLSKLEEKGVISGIDGVNKAKTGLLRSNYNVRFEVRDPNSNLHFDQI